MSLNIAGFIKSLLPSHDRSDVETDLEISLEAIPAILEAYGSLDSLMQATKFTAKPINDRIKEFYKELNSNHPKVKLTPQKNFSRDTSTLFANVKANGEYVLKQISDAVNDVVVSQALTAYRANLMRAAAHYFFMTRYAMDLVNYIYVMEAENGKIDFDREYGLNKKQKQFIEDNMWIYARMLGVYGNAPEEFKDKLEAIDSITLPKESVDEVADSFDSQKIDLFNNLPAGFIGSPIYSIRMIFAQWEADRYRSMKDKRRLLELRLLHLKLLKEQGESDVNTEKEIIYLQNRITDYDYELNKIEKDVQ